MDELTPQKRTEFRFLRRDFAILLTLLVLATILRTYKITAPLTDHHSWRQADTAAVARNFARDGFDLLHPRYDDLSSIQSGLDNPQGYRFVEFPLYNATFAALYKYLPILSLEAYGRLVSLLSSLAIIIILYLLLLSEEGRIAAAFGAFTYAVMPFFVYYSRVILPNIMSLSLSLLAIFFLYLWVKKRSSGKTVLLFGLSLFSFALALLVRPLEIFFVITLVFLFFRKYGFSLFKKISFYVYFILSIVPTAVWRWWFLQFPEGIPKSDWLIIQVNTYRGKEIIFFRPAFFRWIFQERIGQLILGGYLVTFLLLGILKKPKKSFFFYSLGFSVLLYLFVFQGGNVQHDYYQIMILPVLASFVGIGVSFLLTLKKQLTHILLTVAIVIVVYGLSFFFSYYSVRDFYSYINNQMKFAKIIQTLTPPDAKIVTDSLGDTTLLYLADRKGSPAYLEDLSQMKNKGMEYFITLNSETATKVKENYELLFENKEIYIFKL